LIEKRRDRLVNRQPAQAARVAGWTTFLLTEEQARRPGWSSTSGQQGSSYAKDSRTKADSTGGGLMREVRRHFDEELRALEGEVQQTGTQARLLLERALQALGRGDPAVCDEVIRGDDEVDRLYLDVERRILHLFALQTPVASDLRLLTALLHVNLHLERIADQAVNMAKITKLADGLPPISTVLQHLEEMGALAVRMVGAAMARRDLDLARRLPELDDPLDRMNRGMLQEVLAASDDRRMLEWGSGCMSCRARSSGSATTRWTSASRWPSWSRGSSASSPTPRIRRSNIPSCWSAEGRRIGGSLNPMPVTDEMSSPVGAGQHPHRGAHCPAGGRQQADCNGSCPR
jgi:phosphate transport system protein